MSVCGNHRQAAARAIRTLRRDVRWKPRKDRQHLAKRKVMGHLPDTTTMEDYNALIITKRGLVLLGRLEEIGYE